jgi:dolichol-phosphate mannosyltransferase
MKVSLKSIAVIVPTYNEKENIIALIDAIRGSVGNVSIYVVDDNSPDGTQDLVHNYIAKHKSNVSLIMRKSKSGRGGAVLEGFGAALKDPAIEYLVEMDADFSHDPAQMHRLLDKRKPRTVVVASRYVAGSKIMNWPLKRKITSRLANAYIRTVLQVPVNDCTNGYRCYPRQAAISILESNVQHKGFIALSETLYFLSRSGFSFVEVPFIFTDREKGKSNASFVELLTSIPAILSIRAKYFTNGE